MKRILIFLLLCSVARAAPVITGTNGFDSLTASGSSYPITLPSVALHDVILLGVRVGSGQTMSTPTNSGTADTWTQIDTTETDGAGNKFYLWKVIDAAASASTFTVTMPLSGTQTCRAVILQASGCNNTTPVDVFAHTNGASQNTFSGATSATAQAVELVAGFVETNDTVTFQPGAGWTAQQTAGKVFLETLTATATGTQNATASLSASSIWSAFCVALQAVPGPTPTASPSPTATATATATTTPTPTATATTTPSSNLCVGPTATGNGSGTDWNNIKPWTDTPTRGQAWYLADGTYGGKTLSTANSGTTLITIQKATVANHVTSTGWLDAMGDGTANFTDSLVIRSDHWIFDGQTGGGPGSWTTGYGFKFGPMTQNEAFINDTGNFDGVSNDITIKHIEMAGTDANPGQSFPHYNGFCFFHYGSNLAISYVYVHDVADNAFDFRGGDNITIEYVYSGIYGTYSAAHAECYWINPHQGSGAHTGFMTNVTVRYSVMAYLVDSTGGLLMGDVDGVYVYGNLFLNQVGGTSNNGNGVVASWSAFDVNNVNIYNNTFYDYGRGSAINFPATSPYTATNIHVRNNIFVNAPPGLGGTTDHDYNFSTGTTLSGESHGVTGGQNPFIAPGSDYHIVSYIGTGWPRLHGVYLSAYANGDPVNTDMDGVPRGNANLAPSMGAFEWPGRDAVGAAQPTVVFTPSFIFRLWP